MSLSREVVKRAPSRSWWTVKNPELWRRLHAARIPAMVTLVTPTIGNHGSTSSQIMKARKRRADLEHKP